MGTVIAEFLPLMDEVPSVFQNRFFFHSGVLALKGLPKSIGHYSVKLRE